MLLKMPFPWLHTLIFHIKVFNMTGSEKQEDYFLKKVLTLMTILSFKRGTYIKRENVVKEVPCRGIGWKCQRNSVLKIG